MATAVLFGVIILALFLWRIDGLLLRLRPVQKPSEILKGIFNQYD